MDVEWDPSGPAPRLTVIDYTATAFERRDGADLASGQRAIRDPSVSWVHVQGQISSENLKRLGEEFGLHPLALEDVVHLGQRPKVDAFEASEANRPTSLRSSPEAALDAAAPEGTRARDLFVILAVPRFREDHLVVDQVSLFLGSHYVVSFQESDEDLFGPVRIRIAQPRSRFRARGAAALGCYRLSA